MSLVAVQAADLRSAEIVEKYHYGINCNHFESISDWVILDFIRDCIDVNCYGSARASAVEEQVAQEFDCGVVVSEMFEGCSEASIAFECEWSASGTRNVLTQINLPGSVLLSNQPGFHFPYDLTTTALNLLISDLNNWLVYPDRAEVTFDGTLTIKFYTTSISFAFMTLADDTIGTNQLLAAFSKNCLQ
jgi:hypothetical protein